MNLNRSKYYISFLALAIFFASCTEEVNFDQADQLAVEPVLASSIFYFESTEEVINLAGTGAFYSQIFTFDAFSEAFIADKILDGVMTYELENTTSKLLDIVIEFIDESGSILDTEVFVIDPEPAPITEIQVAYGNGGKSLDILRNTTDIRIQVANRSDDSSVSNQQEPKIILRSSAAFTVKLR